ncbi:MAG: TonB-dependent receptor [Bacteroidetes bacterium]|nr:TonB-dependent receptor [Bacteroidota bacterium]
MKLKLGVLVIFAALFLYASSARSQCSVTGTVYDFKDGTPLKEVTVRVLNVKDSSVVKGTVTDESGFFTVTGLKNGKYTLALSYIGYKNYYRKISFAEKSDISLDTIKLRTDGYSTDEIKVESDAPDMRLEDEKKVFDAEKLTSTKGGTALDVLKKVPMVDVDADDNVTLRGSTNVLILVDDKPMKFGSLRQIPADAIKNVEIITNPSAKYEAEGVTGIINIVMQPKKDDVLGYNGYVYTGIRGELNGGYLGGGVNIRKNKWSFFVNGGGGIFKRTNDFISETYYDNPVYSFVSNSSGSGTSNFGFGTLGAEYEISKGHAIGTEINFNPFKYDQNSNGHSREFFSSGLPKSLYDNGSSGNGYFTNFGASIYYNGKLKKPGHELNVDMFYGNDGNDNTNEQYQQYYDSLFVQLPLPNKQKSVTTNKNYNLRLQVDYTNPISDNTKLEAGYKGTYRSNDNDYTYDTLNYAYNGYIRSQDLTNHFKLNESINAVYATLSQKIKNFRIKLGLRAEHTHTHGELVTNNYIFTKDYIDFFPTVSLSQKIGNSNELQLSYSRRITRPNIWRLNPFVNRYNNRYVNYGNPELLPEFTNSFELSHNFYSNFITVTTSVFYRQSYDVMTSYSYVQDSTTTVTTYKNGAGSKSYGADLIVRSSALKFMTLNGTLSMYQSKFDASAVNDYKSEEGFTWRANVRSSINVFELFSIELFYNYTGKKFSATGYNDPMQNFDIGINKELLKKKLTVGIRAEDVFKTRKWGGENNGIGYRTVSSSTWDSRIFFINISYNFGNTDQYYQKSKRTKQNENETQDEKQDNK